MIEENVFVPKILLCGDIEEFFSQVGQRPCKLVGQVEFPDIQDESQIKFVECPDFSKILRENEADFIVFNDDRELKKFSGIFNRLGCPRSQVMTLREFKNLPTDGFYDMHADILLLIVLKKLSIKTLLDVDAHFVKSQLFTKRENDLTEIDCICREEILPIKENFFRHVYKSFSDCAFRHYDAALINDKSPTDFEKAVARLQDIADCIIVFARYNSELEKHIRNRLNTFKDVQVCVSNAGNWFFCYRHTPPEDFAIYVVTHKKLPLEHVDRLPEGYRIIHAGRALGKDLGYLGDDTGDNISNLNSYINEITALYWMWKNTSHTVVGLSHYRRFFTSDGKNILTKTEILKTLESYDIIVNKLNMHRAPSFEVLRDDICGEEGIVSFSENIIRKNIMRVQPDYLDAFNLKMNSPTCFYFNMFIARRPVFDAYCEWLFSFMIDSTREILKETSLSNLTVSERRLPAHFSERMMTVWLMKNRLRIKEIDVLFVPGI